MIQGDLCSKGIWVSRRHTVDSLVCVHPLTDRVREARRKRQGVYQVPAPNPLWHIDSSLKLAKYGLPFFVVQLFAVVRSLFLCKNWKNGKITLPYCTLLSKERQS